MECGRVEFRIPHGPLFIGPERESLYMKRPVRLEALFEDGKLSQGIELFVFTDNSTAESAFYRSTSSSKELFELVLRIRKLELNGSLFLHVIWVAGTRMIAQGTDGLSCGDLDNGVLAGDSMLLHVPLNVSALDRQPQLRSFFLGSVPESWEILTPESWFDEALSGCLWDNSSQISACRWMWFPPPAAADVALEQLCESKHIQPHSCHVFASPALMSNRWRKKLGKGCDVVFTLPVGIDLWPRGEHEPIIVGLTCPLLSCSPWQVKFRRDRCEALGSALSEMWATRPQRAGDLLRKFWTQALGEAAVPRLLA